MTVDLNISLDRANLAKFRTLITANRTIAAKSLTFTAERARDAWRLANHHVFHMRRPWIDKGVQVRAATPGNLVARVGSVDKYMGRHVVGVDDPKVTGGKGLFVPVQPASEQGTHTQLRAKLRRMASTKTAPFWRHGVLLRRLGRGHDAALSVIAVMRRSVNIRPRLDAERIAYAAVQTAYPSVYERLLLKWAETA